MHFLYRKLSENTRLERNDEEKISPVLPTYVQFFNYFGVASIWVRLLFEGGLYVIFWVCKTGKSGQEQVKWKWNLTLERFRKQRFCNLTIQLYGWEKMARTHT